jgi:hypothetical protein
MPVPVRPRPVVPLPLAEPASYAVHPPPLSHATGTDGDMPGFNTSAAGAQSSPCVASLGKQPHQTRSAAMIRPAREKWIFSNDTTVASAGQGGRHRPGATPRVATRWDQLICGGRGSGGAQSGRQSGRIYWVGDWPKRLAPPIALSMRR